MLVLPEGKRDGSLLDDRWCMYRNVPEYRLTEQPDDQFSGGNNGGGGGNKGGRKQKEDTGSSGMILPLIGLVIDERVWRDRPSIQSILTGLTLNLGPWEHYVATTAVGSRPDHTSQKTIQYTG